MRTALKLFVAAFVGGIVADGYVLPALKIEPAPGIGMDDVARAAVIVAVAFLLDRFI